MYELKYHHGDLSDKSFLVTGGAGFIGSNLVEYLLKYGAKKVRVLDNLSNGYYANIQPYIGLDNFEFIQGDIRDYDTCILSLMEMDFVSHQAALGSVPRSIVDPITSNDVNISGFLNILTAVKESPHIKKMVYAASSSTYGDSEMLPKIEGNEGKPLSPYAVTKAVNEMYANVFSNVYNLHTIGLRYFNIFGPRQNAKNPYAAVIAKACDSFINDAKFILNGDGLTTRDFTFVENAVQANIKALLNVNIKKHEVVNIACGEQVSLLDMIDTLEKISGKPKNIECMPERKGDVKHSKASIKKAKDLLDYNPTFSFEMGMKIVYEFYKHHI